MSLVPGRIRGALSRAAVRQDQRRSAPPRTRREDLVEWARGHLGGRRLVVVSNREPWSHVHDGETIRAVRNAGGLTVALDAVARALEGTWVAAGTASADRETVDAGDRVVIPPGANSGPRYALRRVWMSDEDYQLYYAGFSNAALWPLCHIAYVRPRFRAEEWARYVTMNQRFADATLEEVARLEQPGAPPPLVFVQDYHLALLPRILRQRRPDLRIAVFWHIPWPNPEVFRILPWRRELLEGLLSADVIGFHIRAHAFNFLDAVATELEARVLRERSAVQRGTHRTWVRNFPIGVDAEELAALAETPESAAAERRLRAERGLEDMRVMLGVDRMDYTKGIPERLEAFERLLEKYPQHRGRVAFIQIGVPSRIELREYRAVQIAAHRRTARVNRRFPRPGGHTLELLEANFDFRELVPFYRMADVCAVTSLHDGMNLVAKEYVAASPDLEGALVLSPYTGAARELEPAHIASPYDPEGLADAYHRALTEPPEERRARMAALRETVLRYNVFDWAIDVLDTVESLTLRTPQARGAAGRVG
jgi:alpha,alpha-trehalose-phosphate synthase [UDP-forming]